MSTITLKDITLKDYSAQPDAYLIKLRAELLKAPVEICIERAQYITEYMKTKTDADMETQPILFRARAVANYLEHKKALFLDMSMLAGSTGSKLKSAPVYPEFIGLSIWGELETITTRKANPMRLTKADAKTLNFDIYPYWINKDVLASTKERYSTKAELKDSKALYLFEKFIFFISGKAGCISHTVPSFERVLKEGMLKIISEAETKASTSIDKSTKEFYESVSIVLRASLSYAKRLSDKASELAKTEQNPQRKKQLEDMAIICKNIPANPAKTFHEAVNCVWLCLIAIHAENINMAISPGRLDQVLYPWFLADMDAGIINMDEAIDIVGSLWVKLGDNVDLVPQVSEELFGGAGTAPAVTIGGSITGTNGEAVDGVNDLTYIMLRVTEILATREPNMNARFHYEVNSKEYRNRVCQVIGITQAVPAFHNDLANIQTLQNQGASLEDAQDYSIIGCVELACSGKSYEASSSILLNLSAPLEMAIYNGKRYISGNTQFGPLTGEVSEFKTFESFLNAFEIQLKWIIKQAVELNENMAIIHQKMLPTPLLSALFIGPLETGKDLIFGGAKYNSSGAAHIAFADAVDSLNAINHAVFVEKRCTFVELIEAVKADFKGHKDLHDYLLNDCPKYGTDKESDDGMSKYLVKTLYDIYQGYTNYRGGKYRPAYWTMTNHAGQGKISHALPNGRKAHTPFASGITPSSTTKADLSECLNSVANLKAEYIPGNVALNIKFTNMKDDSEYDNLGNFVEAYFMQGGQQVQCNIMSQAMLLEAKAFPDKHPNLLVRVSGYSAYFNDLNDTMKDELIQRAEYTINGGKKVEQ